MNPLTNMKNVLKLSERDLQRGGKSSWHDMYGGSAWIFVGGLPFDLCEGDIIAVFSQYGEIVNINLIRDKASGKSKGYGFICYEDQRSTVLCVDNLNGIKILNRTLRVDHVYDYKPPKENDKTDEETRRLYMEGCAPKPQIAEENIKREVDKPSTSKLQGIKKEELKKVKKEKKEKKAKKEKKSKKKKKKKVQSSSSEESTSSDESSSESEHEKVSKKHRQKSKSPTRRQEKSRSNEKDRNEYRRRSRSPSKRYEERRSDERSRSDHRQRSKSPIKRHEESRPRDKDTNDHRRRSKSPSKWREENRSGDKNKNEVRRDKRRSRSRSNDHGFKSKRRSGSR